MQSSHVTKIKICARLLAVAFVAAATAAQADVMVTPFFGDPYQTVYARSSRVSDSAFTFPYSNNLAISDDQAGTTVDMTYTQAGGVTSLGWSLSEAVVSIFGSSAAHEFRYVLEPTADATYSFSSNWSATPGISASYGVDIFDMSDGNTFLFSDSAAASHTGSLTANHLYAFRGSSSIHPFFSGPGGFASGEFNLTITTAAVPEPSSVVLLGVGAISLLAVARRRRKRA